MVILCARNPSSKASEPAGYGVRRVLCYRMVRLIRVQPAYNTVAFRSDWLQLSNESRHLLDQEIPHHAHVLVFEIMAVIHEHALEMMKGLDKTHGFARHHQDGVLQTAAD